MHIMASRWNYDMAVSTFVLWIPCKFTANRKLNCGLGCDKKLVVFHTNTGK